MSERNGNLIPLPTPGRSSACWPGPIRPTWRAATRRPWLARSGAGVHRGIPTGPRAIAGNVWAEIRSLTTEAVKTLRKLVRGADVPPAVRLRACLAILGKRPTRWNRRGSAPLGSAGSRRREVTGGLIESLGE